MTTGRLRYIHLAMLVGISLFIPLFLAYFLYMDLSETVLLPSDMSLEDPEEEDLSTCKNDFKSFLPTFSSNPLSPWTHCNRDTSLISPRLTFVAQGRPVLRC